MTQTQPVNAAVTGDQGPVRVLFVHAHPDDESIATGGTMAACVEQGAQVTLLTATRGESGEVIGDESLGLQGHRAALAAHRERELASAMANLGVSDHRFLGAPGGGAGALDGRTGGILPERRFEDSGMVWGSDGHAAPDPHMVPAALCAAPLQTVASYVLAVLEELQPELVVTYGSGGGYGHPDHRRVHEAVVAAVRSLAAGARADGRAPHGGEAAGGARVPVLLFQETPETQARADFDPQQAGFAQTGFAPGRPPTIAAQAPIAVAQDVTPQLHKKSAAMAAHATQVTVSGPFFALSNGIGQRITTTESYTVAPEGAQPAGGTFVAPASGILHLVAREAAPALSGSAPARREKVKIGVSGVVYTLLLAVIVAVLGSFQHLNATALDLAGQAVVVPWGLLLAIALTFTSMWHLASLYRSSTLVVVAGLVMSGLAFALGQPSLWPGQDLLIFNSVRSLVWLFVPMVMAVIMAFSHPALRAPRRRPAQQGTRPEH